MSSALIASHAVVTWRQPSGAARSTEVVVEPEADLVRVLVAPDLHVLVRRVDVRDLLHLRAALAAVVDARVIPLEVDVVQREAGRAGDLKRAHVSQPGRSEMSVMAWWSGSETAL